MKYIIPQECLHFSHGDEMSVDIRNRLEEIAIECGESYDSYLITEPNRKYLWLKDLSGVVGFAIRGKYVNVVGGLIALPDSKWRILNAILEFSRLNHLTLSVFNVNHLDLGLFRDFEFQVTKFGEDFVVDLSNCDFAGRRFEWVRRQSNFCRRHGVTVKEVHPERLEPSQWQSLCGELLSLEKELLETKAQAQPTAVFQGRLTPDNLGKRRLFVAFPTQELSRPQGFIVLNPYNNRNCWSVEIYRYSVNAPRGIAPYLIHQAMLTLKEEGVKEVSLCIVPGINCSTPMPGDSRKCRWLMTFWYKHLNFITDMRGIFHFKSRFRPEQRPVYVCVYPRITFGSIFAFLMVWGVLKVDPFKAIKSILRQSKNRKQRGLLAEPQEATP